MNTRSLLSLVLGLAAGVALTACGGGGSGGSSVAAASLRGAVILNNGSTANLGGISLTNPNTGKIVVTAPDGSFNFGTVPAGTVTIRLGGVAPVRTGEVTPADDGGGKGESGDGVGEGGVGGGEAGGDDDIGDDQGDDANDGDVADDGDGHDVGDDDADTTGVTGGEVVEVRLAIRNGKIESIQFGQSHDDDRECEGHLTKCASSDDPDVEGSVRAESRPDRQRLVIEVEHATAGRSLVAVVIDGSAVEASLGTKVVSLDGRAEWSINTATGGGLPFGVATAADLVGFHVEVRDAANAAISLVCGTISDLPNSAGDQTHVDSDGRAGLTRVGAPVGSEAHVRIKHRTGDEARDEFGVDAEHMGNGTVVNVWLENPSSAGTFTLVGALTVHDEGEGELEISTNHGAALPYAVASVTSLIGLRVELRSPASVVLFTGVVPPLATR